VTGRSRGRLDPAVAQVRRSVRRALADLEPGETALVACSGGPDSTALAAATAFESRAAGWRVAAVVVDHGLQDGSARVADAAASRLRDLGLDPVTVVAADVVAGGDGPEGDARAARYTALAGVAEEIGARCVLLGHTLDDQAETVLLGLARGSGARSLSAMRPRSGIYRRPLLDLGRVTTERACAAEHLTVWNDPHNTDPAFARVRVRHRVLQMLETELGPGVAEALARTARLLRDDADALDELAAAARADCRTGDGLDPDLDPGIAPGVDGGLDVERLAVLLPAVRRRVLRAAALDAGCPATDVTAGHVDAVEALVTDWHGQRGVDLPGSVQALRSQGVVRMRRRTVKG
jgi:tRNA(Ile)-lysidine synthase